MERGSGVLAIHDLVAAGDRLIPLETFTKPMAPGPSPSISEMEAIRWQKRGAGAGRWMDSRRSITMLRASMFGNAQHWVVVPSELDVESVRMYG
jgi:hypothetical protein